MSSGPSSRGTYLGGPPPRGVENRRVVVEHGGRWRAGDKDRVRERVRRFRGRIRRIVFGRGAVSRERERK